MPERKSPSAGRPTSGTPRKPGGTGRPAGASSGRGATGRASGTTTSANGAGARPRKNAAPPPRGAGGRPPNRKAGKSIVNQKQTPWGLIIVTAVIVLFAAGIVAVVVATSGGKSKSSASKPSTTTNGGQSVNANDPYRHPELAAAKAIPGVTYTVEAEHNHVDGTIKYDHSPPIGGDHNALWANCNGNVYTTQIANENAVHMLEHGAVWVTYNPKTLSKSGVAKLATYVKGQDRTAMSPYAGLKTPISLQAWGYQLFVSSPADPRIAQFIKVLKFNPQTTPENADCSNPYFKAADSTPGHPQTIQ
ncbi:DUF3105 domain-containing protein [uncultured Jatrophihabitans sp.]|uniref:DUF3105 domain-containing protein n=1 Tax=uncultured Jatrophihabitans sp. TaxID=1610747 RepID=UPI0035CC9BE1